MGSTLTPLLLLGAALVVVAGAILGMARRRQRSGDDAWHASPVSQRFEGYDKVKAAQGVANARRRAATRAPRRSA